MIKKLLLAKFNIIIIFLLFVFSGTSIAQCTITGASVNASTLTCGTSPLSSCNGVLYIGDGTVSTNFKMDTALNLTCLGSIQLIVRNGSSLDFTAGNDYLNLAAGSSIIIENGGFLIGGSCNASERIYIGGNLVASCNGGATADVDFTTLSNLGGTGLATSNSPVCVGNSINLIATPPPKGGQYTYSWSGPGLSSTPFISSPNYSVIATVGGVYQVKMKSSIMDTRPNPNVPFLMIAETTVVVNSKPTTPTITAGSSTTFCLGGSVTLNSSAASGNQWYKGGGLISGATSNTYNATTSGTYTVTTNNGTCSSSVSTGTTVTVNTLPDNTLTGFSSSSFCIGNQATITFNGDTGSGVLPYTLSYRSDTTTPVTYSETITTNDPTPIILNPNPTVTTHYTLLSITDAKGCVNSLPKDTTAEVTILSLPSTPIPATPTQPTCTVATGSVILSDLPASGTWTLTRSGTSSATTSGTGTSITISGLAVGTYNFTVTNAAGCTSSASANVPISIGTSTWTVTAGVGSWNSGTPTLNTLVILASNYDTAINPNINACSLIINPGATLTIRDQKFVTILNDLTVSPGATIEVESQGSLVMVNDLGTVTNGGTINVHKTTSSFERYDYTYWSSPIVGPANIAATFPTWRIDYAFAFHPENFIDANNDGFDDDGDDYLNASTMDPGRGYIIMGPTTGSFPRTESVTFTGTVNNGVVTTPIALTPGAVTDDDWNLVGNPYPSAISADAFITANVSEISQSTIDGTLYFWTHKMDISASNPGPDTYNFSSDDYAVYNLSGGVGTQGSYVGGTNGVGGTEQSNKPNGYIASGQSFFVEASVGGVVTFNNSMRVSPSIAATPSTANSQFYKILPVKSKSVDRNRIWLNLENSDGMFSQQLVGYFDNTTLGYDNGYDGLLSDAGNYINFYSFIDQDAYKIQGRATFDEDDQVRLGYSSAVAGTFNINIDSKEGVFDDDQTNVYLEDKLTNSIHNLKESPYSFETESGTFNDRFVLRYVNTNKTLATDSFDTLAKTVLISNKNKQLKINSSMETIDKVQVYDLLGRSIYKKTNVSASELVILNLVSSEQTLVVKIILENGKTVTKKIIY
jgi:hypothetical protein